jgi:hypothetical protein
MKDLISSRLRGAELRELVEELGEYSDRMLQNIVNSTIPGTDEDRNRGGDSGAIITSNSIFGISFTTIFNVLIVGAVVLIAWTYYKKNNK